MMQVAYLDRNGGLCVMALYTWMIKF